MSTTRSVTAVLMVGLILMSIAIIAILARSPFTVAGTNSIPAKNYIELKEKGKLSGCQSSGTIPQGTSAIRIGIEGLYFGPAVTAKVLMGSHVLREGHQTAGGVSAPTATVPVRRLADAVHDARVCTTVGPALEPIRYYGIPSHSPGSHASPLQQVTLRMEYMRPSGKSWWSSVSSITYHMGLGRAPSGAGAAILALLLALALVALAARITLEELR